MSFRGKRLRLAGITAALMLFSGPSPVLSKDDATVDLTIYYSGDEYGYLEPCG